MKYKILGLIGVVWGGLLVANGVKHGLRVDTNYATGQTIAFGFGALIFLAGASALWHELNGRDASLHRGNSLLMLLVAVGLTIAVLRWGPSDHPFTVCSRR